ncbi:SurA N-terminal domain-containing protein [Paenibacillus endoradicis]|uniref:SurA N-terminal domain-containing protein n=1 Tax=Paenibacillus endoradicis TaxID=2972487 RepID=UPI002158DE86|nr:SurA N-terminal domain-containing protein [Paenibacillus endoradicis]MCR8660083.1 SurA N-terminal domain-containing protein [Paenibacillus endoradicis]
MERRTLIKLFVIIFTLLAVTLSYFIYQNEQTRLSNSVISIAGNEEIIQSYFNKIYDESITDKGKVIAKTADFQVTKFDFLYSKYSTEMFNELGANTKKTNDKKIINNLVARQLMIVDAKSKGITVEDDEVNTFIETMKDDFLNSEQVDVQQNDTLILFKAWAQSANLTLEQFIDSELLRDQYEEGAYFSKLYEYLSTEKIVTSMKDFEKYQDDLFDKQRRNIDITYKNI